MTCVAYGINRSHVAFSVFDGDLKAGGDGPCADSLYYTANANFNRLDRPLVWLPGDNDWTDCWRTHGRAPALFRKATFHRNPVG